MIADESRPIPALGNLDAGVLELGAFCREIVSFIERELPVWRQRPELSQVEDEPCLNQSLCLHLDRASRHNFDSIRFLQEPIQGSGRNADIGALPVDTITVEGITYQDYEQLLPIECKRLPTPSGSRRSDLEYVHGMPGQRTGGIERFKHGLHGRGNRHALMIPLNLFPPPHRLAARTYSATIRVTAVTARPVARIVWKWNTSGWYSIESSRIQE